MPDKRVRLDLRNVNTRFSDGTPAAKGIQHLKNSEMGLRDGLGLAIGVLFGPVQAALDGCQPDEVERMIQNAELACHGYWSQARMIASGTQQEKCSVVPGSPENKKEEDTFELD